MLLHALPCELLGQSEETWGKRWVKNWRSEFGWIFMLFQRLIVGPQREEGH